MCNLYSLTKGQAAIIALVRAMRDRTGNLPPMPGIFPDYPAPIARNGPDGVREVAMARWGMPGPPAFGGDPITNIRNVRSPHWRAWLKPANRCVVPFTSFCEYADTKPRKTPTWFALSDDRPIAVFAGVWTTWHGRRGTKANAFEGEHQLFGFLTTDANAEVGAIHPKAMPVILTTEAEIEQWMTASEEEALKLQRPLPDGALRIVDAPDGETDPFGLERFAPSQHVLINAINEGAIEIKKKGSSRALYRVTTAPQRRRASHQCHRALGALEGWRETGRPKG